MSSFVAFLKNKSYGIEKWRVPNGLYSERTLIRRTPRYGVTFVPTFTYCMFERRDGQPNKLVIDVKHVPRVDLNIDLRRKLLNDRVSSIVQYYFPREYAEEIVRNLEPLVEAVLIDSFFRLR